MFQLSNSFKQIYNKIFHEKDVSGNNWYYASEIGGFDNNSSSNLNYCLKHPILTPAMLFVSSVFSNAKFTVKDISTNKETKNHNILRVLNKPNYYMNRTDLLMTSMFLKISEGVSVLYLKRGLTGELDSIYPLVYSLIEFPKFDKKLIFSKDKDSILEQRVLYDKDGENINIKLKDLVFLYDLPNVGGLRGNNNNPFYAESRITGLIQTLKNANDSFTAKNIILKTNGKELITGSGDSTAPFTKTEKESVEQKFNSFYGLSFNRRRGIVTSSNINWKSLHIALRDLGLDESVKVDGNVIYTALHIPKDILSLEAKKTTYNNFKESMISYIQNVHISEINDFCETLTVALLGDGEELVGTYDHMPIMHEHNSVKYKTIESRATALQSLLNVGIPEELALEMCEFDTTIKLNNNSNNSNNSNENV